MKKVLVISNGPVPPQSNYKIEGGGMRSWGLAIGLSSLNYEVTVAVRDNYPIQQKPKNDHIKLVNWSPGPKLGSLANEFDIVIISYSTGATAAYLAREINDHVTFILDCYVPIYIEVSARKSEKLADSYKNYQRDVRHFNTALMRGDYFLCANEAQKHMYMGVLSSLGIINPYSYDQRRILTVPFGIDSNDLPGNIPNPYSDLGIAKDDFVLLWFGGLYPWFDITKLLSATKNISSKDSRLKLVIVGGKNPYNKDPDFIKQHTNAVEYAKKHDLLDKHIFFVDWVDFDKRIQWYKHADAVISINNPGEENVYSWRTRVMDYVWGEVPIITNGGDPLSEMLIASDSAAHLSSLNEEDISSTISKFTNNRQQLDSYTKNLKRLRKKFYWEKVVEPIHASLQNSPNPHKQETTYIEKIGAKKRKLPKPGIQERISQKPIGRYLLLPIRIARSLKKRGVVNTAKMSYRKISR